MKQEAITGDRYLEIMFPLNDMFRSRWHEVRVLPYSSDFEFEADTAIASLAENPTSAWESLSAGAWRVLLERHSQMQVLASLRKIDGVPLITLPSGLSDDDLRVALMMLLLLQMKLPFPPSDKSQYEIPPIPQGKGS